MNFLMGANDIVLGDGVFAIGATAIGLTRGGGKFSIKREYKEIEADGDIGPVKGRIRKTKSVATLQVKALELLPANLPKMYPATDLDTTTDPTKAVLKAKAGIEDADYNSTVTWTGKTKAGKAVIITIKNAINLEGIDWELKDKDEVVPEVTYTATYDEGSTDEPWEVSFAV